MKIISLISQKGGVGKTTLATCLAVASQQDGKNTVVVDLDPQASASFWKDIRSKSPIKKNRGKLGDLAVTATPPSRINNVLDVAKKEGCDFAVIDAPPFAKDIAFEAAQYANLILIPTKPAVLDVMAMTKTLELVAHYNKLAAVVLSICPIQGREINDTEKTIKKLKADVAPVKIHNRIVFSRAQQNGLAAQELAPKSKAANEIKQLYRYVCKRV